MSEHTPGPWRADFVESGGYDCMTDAYYIKAGTKHIATLDLASYGKRNSPNAEANARLIATAPDLLEACRTAVRLMDTMANTQAARVLDAAIAKATGTETVR